MNNGYVAILDSGIGGFSCFIETVKMLGGEKFLYFGDNKNAPYGDKTPLELFALTRENLSYVLKYDVKALIVGCNTLSVSILPLIAKYYKIPIFGVYPPVKDGRGKTLLFATPVTCARYKNDCSVIAVPLKNLAKDIERNKFHLKNVDIKNHIETYEFNEIDTLILGCTHYYFVKKQFIDHFCPRKVLSGEEFTARNLSEYLIENGLTTNRQCVSIDFIGENAEENYKFYNEVVKNMIFS